jgi:Winged helix-turn helix
MALWTRKLIAKLIQQKFDVAVSLPTVGRIMNKLGMSYGNSGRRFAQLHWYAQMRLGLLRSKRYSRGRRFGRWLAGVHAPARLRLARFVGTVVAPRPNRPWREKPNAGGERRR